jgi:FlaA1/EpsC-like NDP-sugar epimerase
MATGKLAKTDRIDAAVLAHFAEAVRPETRPLADVLVRKLSALIQARDTRMHQPSSDGILQQRERNIPQEQRKRRTTIILVVGATGVVGGMVTRGLLEEGKDVRILVRRGSPSSQLVQRGLSTSAESLIESGAQPVHGDLRDRASLDTALEGIDTVLSTANSAARGGVDNPQSVDLPYLVDL